jgi:hypothetical protein
MLQEHTRIRSHLKEHTVNMTPTTQRKNIRILDIIGTLNSNGAHSLSQQLQSLKDHTSHDNVHLTHEGYFKVSAAVAREAKAMLKEMAVNVAPSCGGRPIPYWHGFVIHQGVGRTGSHDHLGGGVSGGGKLRGGGRGWRDSSTRGGAHRGWQHPYSRN